jgi:hypothetical protein
MLVYFSVKSVSVMICSAIGELKERKWEEKKKKELRE